MSSFFECLRKQEPHKNYFGFENAQHTTTHVKFGFGCSYRLEVGQKNGGLDPAVYFFSIAKT